MTYDTICDAQTIAGGSSAVAMLVTLKIRSIAIQISCVSRIFHKETFA